MIKQDDFQQVSGKNSLLRVRHIHLINMARVAPIPANPAKAMRVFLTGDSGSATLKKSTKPFWKKKKEIENVNGRSCTFQKCSLLWPLLRNHFFQATSCH